MNKTQQLQAEGRDSRQKVLDYLLECLTSPANPTTVEQLTEFKMTSWYFPDIKEAIDKLEKDKKISQDEQKRSLEELEKVSHSETKKIEDLSAMKEKEVMEIR